MLSGRDFFKIKHGADWEKRFFQSKRPFTPCYELNMSYHHAQLQQALAAEETILFAYLFGSVAAGAAAPLSDVDVAIYPTRKLTLDERLGIIQRLGKKTRLENLDVTFLDRLENLYILADIIDHGIVLVDKNPDERKLFEVMKQHQFFDFKYQRKLYMDV
jgi:predicted nucleotidyltransferase